MLVALAVPPLQIQPPGQGPAGSSSPVLLQWKPGVQEAQLAVSETPPTALLKVPAGQGYSVWEVVPARQ